MRLITSTGYYSTGSSAVTDLINECDDVCALGDYEFRFVQDPDGICDLEYNLVLNNHRHNSGYALKRYERNVKFLNGGRIIKKYNRFFGAEWKRLSAEYVKKLVDVEYKGFWHQELRDKGKIAYFIERAVNKIAHKVFRLNRDKGISLFLRNNTNYATYPSEKFYEYTREYIDALFAYVNKENKPFVMADQLVPVSNTSRYLRFFNDIKVICVERDPRDVYIAEREMYKGTVVPKEVEDFCVWYRATRAHKASECDDPERILRINFEDLVYSYDEYADKIFDFCGIDKSLHVRKREFFDPDKSIANTRLYEKYPKLSKEIAYIESNLKDALVELPKK